MRFERIFFHVFTYNLCTTYANPHNYFELVPEFNSSSSVASCLDYLHWSTVNDMDCGTFQANPENCARYGYLNDLYSSDDVIMYNANHSCCACGGGYTGDLIGDDFVVGLTDGVAPFFTQYENPAHDDGHQKDGSIFQFMLSVSESLGVGLYAVKNYSDASDNFLNAGSDGGLKGGVYRSFQRCLFDLNAGDLDACVGPLWQSFSLSNMYNSTVPLYTDEFYLVSPIRRTTFAEYFARVALPFDRTTWISILLSLSYMGIAMNIVRKKSLSARKVMKCKECSGVIDAAYTSLRSFVNGDPADGTNDTATNAERIILIGFIIFSLLILTAFTATMCAFLVSSSSNARYNSINDFVLNNKAMICTYQSINQDILYNHTFLEENLKAVSYDVINILDQLIIENGECDAAILPITHYEYAVAKNDIYCSETKLIYNELLAEIDVAILFRTNLQSEKEELIVKIDDLILNSRYKYFHELYSLAFRNVAYEIAEIDNEIEMMIKNRDMENSRTLRASNKKTSSNIDYTMVDSAFIDSFCSESIGINYGSKQLSSKELSFPIIITLLFTTIGLVVFLIETLQKRYRLSQRFRARWCGLEKIPIRSASKLEESNLKLSHQNLPMSKILQQLRMYDVDDHLIAKAFEELPSKHALVSLLVKYKFSEDVMNYRRLTHMSVYDLFSVLEKFSVESARNISSEFDECAESDDPKDALIRLILENPRAKFHALEQAKQEDASSLRSLHSEHVSLVDDVQMIDSESLANIAE